MKVIIQTPRCFVCGKDGVMEPGATAHFQQVVDRSGTDVGILVLVRTMDDLNQYVHPWLRHLADVAQANEDRKTEALIAQATYNFRNPR